MPDLDRTVIVVGQNVESVNSYVTDVGKIPSGVMSYTSTSSVEGLNSPANYGAGLVWAQRFIDDPAFNNTVLQLGLYLNGDLQNIIAGTRNANISTIGNWIRNARRPVYLRIGYEFDAPWNALPPDQYKAAYHHIVDQMRREGVTNAVYVWHSACSPTFGGHPISAWYPGDDYVDWAGISVFHQFDGTLGTVADIDNFCAFAKAKNKPLMIAESAPCGGMSDARWENWFMPCIELIRRHHIQMWCYINANWDALPLFAGQGWGDARIERSAYVRSNWLTTIAHPSFLNGGDEMMGRLHSNATSLWIEAESADLDAASTFLDAAASGSSAVSLLGPSEIAFTNAISSIQFILRYSASNAGTLGLIVNAQPRRTLPIIATAGEYRDLLVHEAIPAGATVKLQLEDGDVPANVDFFAFRGYGDNDADGLPDNWEYWRFGSLAYGLHDDPDHDGSSNYSEFVADTNPANSESALRITGLTLNLITAAPVSSGPTTRACFVQHSSDLLNWRFMQDDANAEFPDLPISPLPEKSFFRLHVP